MFDSLVIGYLFLGGAGGGALVVLGAFEGARTLGLRRPELPDELFARAWPVCAVALATGIVCIAADLGRPDRLLGLVASPRPTPLAVGAYALVAGLLCAAAFSALALFDGAASRVPRGVRLALAAASLAAGGVTAAYTGVLLQGLASVLFWQTPLLPAAFVLSSLSCGVAVVFLAAAFVETRRPFVHLVAWLARIDGVLIAAEAGVLAVYVAWALAGAGTREAAVALVAGDLAPAFLGGVALAGLAVPFAMERLLTHNNHHSQLLWIAACVLAGGLALRACVAQAGLYDVTQMSQALFGLSLG